jgi:hypothetical protein
MNRDKKMLRFYLIGIAVLNIIMVLLIVFT